MSVRIQWYADRVNDLTVNIPERAHKLAAAEASGLAARAISSSGTGALARDVSRPKFIGSMHALCGSTLRYARMQNFGGTIKPRTAQRLLIRGKRGSSRSDAGGAVVASAAQVTIRGKHYLEVAEKSFPKLFTANLRRMLP